MCYFNIMCAIAKFLLCSSSVFDIVKINGKFTHLFVELLVCYGCMLSSRKYVSMVLRYDLLADSPYAPGRVVDRRCDKPIESFAIHPPSIRLVDNGSWEDHVSFLIFLGNLRGAHIYP
jgi:hypothetical protein